MPLPMVTEVKLSHPENAPASMDWTPLPIMTYFKFLQPEKPLTLVTLSGMFTEVILQPEKTPLRRTWSPLPIVTEVTLVQPAKAPEYMYVTLLGMTMEVKPVQPLNASLPIVVTLFGIVIDVKNVQPSKAFLICLTPLGITKSFNSFPFIVTYEALAKGVIPFWKMASHHVARLFMFTVKRPEYSETPLKAPSFISWTLLPMDRYSKYLQLQKALSPIISTLSPIITEVK